MTLPTLILLVTRFSLPHPSWKSKSAAEYESWLHQRLNVMNRYTVPSVGNMYVKPDRWCILTSNHDQSFVDELNKTVAKSSVPAVILSSSTKPANAMISEYLEEKYPLPLRLCTVRMDSDDLIASDYFARLRSCVENTDDFGQGTAITFPGGAIYSAVEDRFYYMSYPDNPFCAFAEKVIEWESLRGVYHRMHTDLVEKADKSIHLRSSHPMWCSVIHETNLANSSLLRTATLPFSDDRLIRQKFGIRTSS